MSRSPPFFFPSSSNNSSGSSSRSHGHQRAASFSPSQLAALAPPSAAGSNDARSHSASLITTPLGVRGMRRFEQRRTVEENHFQLHQQSLQSQSLPQSQSQSQPQSQQQPRHSRHHSSAAAVFTQHHQAAVLNPPVDLRLVDYVAPLDDNLTCPICRCPFIDPVMLQECEHYFCRDCIRQTWVTASSVYSPHGPRGDCPTCRTPGKLGPRSATNKIIVNILDDLLVKCPNSCDGCPVEVKRGEVQDHVSIYCGYARVECPADDCVLATRRKDISRGCLHCAASCLACHEELQAVDLESHWSRTCPDRVFSCELCGASTLYKDLIEHTQRLCPAVSIPCPGAAIGCTSRSKKEQADIHAKSCTFAKLAPVLDAQRQRLDEQEAAQKEMSKKLEILETSFTNVQRIVFPSRSDSPDTFPPPSSSDSTALPAAPHPSRRDSSTMDSFPLYADPLILPDTGPSLDLPSTGSGGSGSNDLTRTTSHDPTNLTSFPPPSLTGGPYASPLHHLLSMHEHLRDELTRTAAALADLDARHSLQILNETLRMRDDVAYVGAQVQGLQRQVGWLTAERLQRRGDGGGGGAGAATNPTRVGESVERAVNAVGSAVMGAVRIVNVNTGTRMETSSAAAGSSAAGAGAPTRMRRGNSDEGRPTKL